MTFEPNVKPDAGQLKFLIVDDNRLMREMMRSYLFDVASEIRECEDGADALDCYRAFLPDWVLMDWEMRLVDGIAATREIIADFPAAKILMVTNYDDADLKAEASRAGVSGYLLKDDLQSLRFYLNDESRI